MKKLGCILLLALPSIWFFYRSASRFETETKAILKAAEEDQRKTPKPATLAEARRIAQEDAARVRAIDRSDIEKLLKDQQPRLARQAVAQIGGEGVVGLSCRSVGSSSTQQSESAAWWTVDFECRVPGDRLPNKTSVSVRLAKKARGWVLD